MDPVKLIKQDHRMVKALFRKFASATRRSERQKLAEQIIEELSVHSAIEEQLLYPALRARDQRMEDSVLNALEEHHAAKLILAELDDMDVDDERFAAKMHVVQESVQAHIEQEEQKLLPRVDRLLTDDELEALAEAIVVMKRLAPNHPHPKAPDTPGGGTFVAMLAKLSDGGKDMVRKIINGDKAAGHRRVVRRAKVAAMIAKRQSARTGRGAAAH